MNFRFADLWLLALLVLPLLVFAWRERRGGAAFPGFALAARVLRASRGPALFRLLVVGGIAALVVAAARPQYGRTVVEREQAGRDLVLVIDLSGSMQINDLTDEQGRRSDRLNTVMNAAHLFIANRPNDRIGLVFFGDQALTSCPLTYDHDTVAQFLERTERQQRALWKQGKPGLLGSNTNMGLGMGMALRCLRDTKSLGRAMVIITDGADSRELRPYIDPLVCARHAQAIGVRIHAIGVGNPEGTMTQEDRFGGQHVVAVPQEELPDMPRLQSIVALADGKAFTANDRAGLDQVFKRIDALEPTPHNVRTRDDFSDRFALPLALGLAFIALALVLETRLRGVA
jgi:Ca-activated chloride channel family protein